VDRIDSYKVICKGGLNSNENHLDLAANFPGAATRLMNYEPSLFGGYRRIEGFDHYDTTVTYSGGEYGQEVQALDGSSNPVAEGKILGLCMYRNEILGSPYIIAARKDVSGNTYSFWKHITGSGWSKITTGLTHNTVSGSKTINKIRHVQFNFGSGSMVAFVDGINPLTIFDGTNWKQVLSTNSGGSSSAGGPNAYDAPETVEVFEDYLFIAGDTSYQNGISHSAPQDPYTWTTAADSHQYSAGFKVVQLKPFREDLFVFGQNAIKKLAKNTAQGATAPFKPDNVTSNVGCVARDSVQELGGDLIFLSPDGLRPVSGTANIGDVEIRSISKNIQGKLTDIIRNEDLDTLNSTVIRAKSQIRFFVGDNTSEGKGILGGLTSTPQGMGWEFSELLGFKVSVCTSEYIGAEEYVLHGGFDGKVYRQETGNSLAGDNIISLYSTPFLDFGDTEIRKVIHKLNTFIRAEGPFTMLLNIEYDWSDPDTSTPRDYSQNSTGAPTVYGGRNITYNATDVKYGGSSKPVIVSDIQGSGYSTRATFVTDAVASPHSIQGLVFEFAQSGKR